MSTLLFGGLADMHYSDLSDTDDAHPRLHPLFSDRQCSGGDRAAHCPQNCRPRPVM
jgi:hypothetical protein